MTARRISNGGRRNSNGGRRNSNDGRRNSNIVKENTFGVLKMISSALKDMRKGKKQAKAENKKNQWKNKGDILSSSWHEGSVCSESPSIASSQADTVFEMENTTAAESIQFLAFKAQELRREVQGSLSSVVAKEASLSKAMPFHMDRAKGRFESENFKGCILSLRRLKSIQQEYQHVNDAIQFFTFRKLELDRFCNEIEAQRQDPHFDLSTSSLEQQALQICSSINEDTLKNVLQEPDTLENTKQISDEELLKELKENIMQQSWRSKQNKGGNDDASTYSGMSSDEEEDEDYEDDDDDDTDFSLSEQDEDLVRDIMAIRASSASIKLEP